MTKKEAIRQTHQEDVLQSLGFTRDEAKALRRISIRLRSWHERECGIDGGCIERDETTGKTFWLNSMSGRRFPIRDMETGARKRLAVIVAARNERLPQSVCSNCEQWQHGGKHDDCANECVRRGFAPSRRLSAYIQTDPRGCALYILRPGDVPTGADVSAYYSRGIAVY